MILFLFDAGTEMSLNSVQMWRQAVFSERLLTFQCFLFYLNNLCVSITQWVELWRGVLVGWV